MSTIVYEMLADVMFNCFVTRWENLSVVWFVKKRVI